MSVLSWLSIKEVPSLRTMQTLSNNTVSILSGFLVSLGRVRDDRRINLGLKFFIPGFSWAGKFSKYFFGWLDGIFWVFKKI